VNTYLIRRSRAVHLLAAIAAAVLFTSTASAQEAKWYAGAMLEDARIGVARSGDPFSYEVGSGAFAYALRGGLRLTKHIGVDFALQHTSDLKWTEPSVNVPGVGLYNSSVAFDTNDAQISGVGILPFAKIWEGFVRFGIDFNRHSGQQLLTNPFGGATFTRAISGNDITYVNGVGVGVTLAEVWHLKLEFASLGLDESIIGVDDDQAFAWVSTMAFGVERRFGRARGGSDTR
jgi:hypothetical protein